MIQGLTGFETEEWGLQLKSYKRMIITNWKVPLLLECSSVAALAL